MNIETVRYYERRGLMDKPDKPAQGWRVYGDDALRRIRFIKRAQSLGFSLDEIAELLALRESSHTIACERAAQRVRGKIEDLAGRIAELASMRDELSALVGRCEQRGPSASCAILDAFDGN